MADDATPAEVVELMGRTGCRFNIMPTEDTLSIFHFIHLIDNLPASIAVTDFGKNDEAYKSLLSSIESAKTGKEEKKKAPVKEEKKKEGWECNEFLLQKMQNKYD